MKEKQMRIATFAAATLMTLVSSLAVAQSVTYDYDRTAGFGRFKTYAWVRGTDLADQLNHKRVLSAVDEQLTAKGLAMVQTSASPDLLVAYHATFDKNLQITGFSSGFGPYRLAGARSGSATAERILVGTLVVDVVDAKTNTIVWRGTATKEIDVHANAEQRDRNIRKAAEKLFKNYPPAARAR
jgi:hypothetical protein